MNIPITDPIKLLLAVTAVTSLIFNIYQYINNRGRLRLSVGIGHTSVEDGEGTYFGLEVGISNIGRTPIYFSGLKAIQFDKDHFYPSFSVHGGIKIEPGESVVGYIPHGHILNSNVRDLVAFDGVWNPYRVPRKKLKKAIAELKEETHRLQLLTLQ